LGQATGDNIANNKELGNGVSSALVLATEDKREVKTGKKSSGRSGEEQRKAQNKVG